MIGSMTKITLDRETFKALASDTRLDILKALDGKSLGLNEIARDSNLNKATLHEHLTKLHEAGLIKRNERDGHKWVYYKLTWKGESLLHPENTKIVIMFTTTFIALWVGIIELIWYIKGTIMNFGYNVYTLGDQTWVMGKSAENSGLLSGLGPNTTAAPSWHLGLPDFLQDFITRAKLANAEGIPLNPSINYLRDSTAPPTVNAGDGGRLVVDQSHAVIQAVYQNPLYLNIAIGCFIVFTVLLAIGIWRLWENRTPKI
jgi:DNA-binding transcriptional ArsR family regulator